MAIGSVVAASPAPFGVAAARALNQNLLLSALPTEDYQRLAVYIQRVTLRRHDVLHTHAQPVDYVYFPSAGLCSLTTTLSEGRTIEVAAVGREGVVGLGPILGGSVSVGNASVVFAGEGAQRVRADIFKRELGCNGGLTDLVSRYRQALIAQMIQFTACNGAHGAEQRLARWLLATHDRMKGARLPVTQSSLAAMLGVSRPTVSIVAGGLQKAGVIEYRHGRLAILDAAELGEYACECYQAGRAGFDRLLPGFLD